MKPRHLWLTIALCGMLAWTSACGPATSTSRISKAERALERARVADAQVRAPYEYNLATNYLHKAKEEWGYSDFERSGKYAELAQRSAERAVTKAKEDPWPGSPVPKAKQLDARRRTSKRVRVQPKTDPLKVKPQVTPKVKPQADPKKTDGPPDDILEDTSGM